ncbi:hypothetical protein L0222_21970 [bacterium]|nr:hypothetical protein [bacterium]
MKQTSKHRGSLIGFILVITLFLSANVFAETRAAQLAAKQAEKAKVLEPYKPTKAEKWISNLEKSFAGTATGFYPYFGSAYAGGGFALGAGYRNVFGDTGGYHFHGAYSIRGYKMFDAGLRLPAFASGRMKTTVNAHYVDADEVAFFGIGNETDEDDEAAYSFTPITFGVTEEIYLTRELHVGGGISYESYETDTGNSARVPSLEDVFLVPDEAPGFRQDFKYITGTAFAEFDWRESPGYTTSGGLYRVDWTHYKDREDGDFDFRRTDITLIQHVPILRGNQGLAFRALISTTGFVGDTQFIPFFLLPKLGGGSELRGFRDFRFRDNHRMLLTGEYRWRPSKFMDMAIFYEVGKVGVEREDLDFEDLHSSYGIGARFHGPNLSALRLELARSTEGMRIIISGGAAF